MSDLMKQPWVFWQLSRMAYNLDQWRDATGNAILARYVAAKTSMADRQAWQQRNMRCRQT